MRHERALAESSQWLREQRATPTQVTDILFKAQYLLTLPFLLLGLLVSFVLYLLTQAAIFCSIAGCCAVLAAAGFALGLVLDTLADLSLLGGPVRRTPLESRPLIGWSRGSTHWHAVAIVMKALAKRDRG